MYYIVSEMYITKLLFDNCFFLFFFAIPNKWYLLWLKNPWFPITLHKEHQTYRNFNTIITNAITKQIKWMKNLAQFFEQKILFHASIKKKNICKIVCKRQCLKCNVSDGSVSLVIVIFTDVFCLVMVDREWRWNYPQPYCFLDRKLLLMDLKLSIDTK